MVYVWVILGLAAYAAIGGLMTAIARRIDNVAPEMFGIFWPLTVVIFPFFWFGSRVAERVDWALRDRDAARESAKVKREAAEREVERKAAEELREEYR